MQMPAGLWRSLELASVLMGVDTDLTQPPCFESRAKMKLVEAVKAVRPGHRVCRKGDGPSPD
jgi:hypothetical protein